MQSGFVQLSNIVSIFLTHAPVRAHPRHLVVGDRNVVEEAVGKQNDVISDRHGGGDVGHSDRTELAISRLKENERLNVRSRQNSRFQEFAWTKDDCYRESAFTSLLTG